MANAEQIRKVCSIITSDPERRVVVVSAPGKRFDSDIKITDMLIDCAENFLRVRITKRFSRILFPGSERSLRTLALGTR